jgi:hypothetical protein
MIIGALHRPQINSLFLLALIPETLPNRGIFGEVTQSSVAPDDNYPRFRPTRVVYANRAANSIWFQTGYDQPIIHLSGGADNAIRPGFLSVYLCLLHPPMSSGLSVLARRQDPSSRAEAAETQT